MKDAETKRWVARYLDWCTVENVNGDEAVAEINRNRFLMTLGGFAVSTQKTAESVLKTWAIWECRPRA